MLLKAEDEGSTGEGDELTPWERMFETVEGSWDDVEGGGSCRVEPVRVIPKCSSREGGKFIRVDELVDFSEEVVGVIWRFCCSGFGFTDLRLVCTTLIMSGLWSFMCRWRSYLYL